jgi:hypothetical protein
VSRSDTELLELVQRQTFRYFWEFAYPRSGIARDRCDQGLDTVVTGGSGFGVMAIIVAAERNWIPRQEAVDRLAEMTGFLLAAASYHGVFPHMRKGDTGKSFHLTRKDDGEDLTLPISSRDFFARDNISIATMPRSGRCGHASPRSGKRPSGTGTRAAVRISFTGIGAPIISRGDKVYHRTGLALRFENGAKMYQSC